VISEDMLSTLFYIQKDKRKTLEFFKVIYKRWVISSFGKDVIKKAIDLSFENSLDLEDVLQCLCAKENGCDVLITNDKKFYDCDIKIMTIKEFLL
jgi:predicted nucleic acid-binding protein